MLVAKGYTQLTLGAGSTGLGSGLSSAASAIPAANGTGYRVGDFLAVAGGTVTPGVLFSTTRFKVETINNQGGVSTVSVNRKGSYTSTPANSVSTTSSGPGIQPDVAGGVGTGCTLTVTWSTPAIPPGATSCLLQAEAQNIRFRDDGVDPTSAVGVLLVAGFSPILFNGDLKAFRAIRVAAGAILNCSFYG